uniref:Uncharacterized protein n=1 Tax=Theileria annulata TaxID=5874 RepID=A0A3B0MKT4_THEAN
MPTSISTRDSTKKSSFFSINNFKITKLRIVKNRLVFLISHIKLFNLRRLCLWVRKWFRKNKVFSFLRNCFSKISKSRLFEFILNNDMSELLVDSSLTGANECVPTSTELVLKEPCETDSNSPSELNNKFLFNYSKIIKDLGGNKDTDGTITNNNEESTSDDLITGCKKTSKTVSFSSKKTPKFLGAYNFNKLRSFTSEFRNDLNDIEEYKDAELEFEEYCEEVKDFVVLDRLNEAKNLGSLLTRLNVNGPDHYLKRFEGLKVDNLNVVLNQLNQLKIHSNALYNFTTCGFQVSQDHLKKLVSLIHNHYIELLSSYVLEESGDHENNTEYQNAVVQNENDPNGSKNSRADIFKLSEIFATLLLTSSESGLFKDDPNLVCRILESTLFGKMFEPFAKFSSGRLINSVLFVYSISQLFEKDYDVQMEGIFDRVIQTISIMEIDINLSDLFYLKLSVKFILNRNPGLGKKISKESSSFLSNVVFQNYIKEKELHGLEDVVPLKIKEIDSNIEGGVFSIGPFDFTHVSLPNKNVYISNKPHYYFNSSPKFGKREYLNWMDTFLKINGWNLIHL